ncbi:MAG TPA: pilin [Usitatibacter sp.]|nr:pilin [Usitatibacter sp.]
MTRNERGFTLIELMIVIAIIGILSTLAAPSFQDRAIRSQVAEGLLLGDFAKQSVAAYYAHNHRMPADNAAAGLPPSGAIVGNYVSDVLVRGGAIVITFGNRVNANAAGKKLTLRPATVEGYPSVPLAWVCGNASTPGKMKVAGENETTLPNPHLPIDCR